MTTKPTHPGTIEIKADLLDADRCRFTADRPVFRPGGSALFNGPDKAKGSPLAERLFEIKHVSAVQLAGNTVIVAKKGGGDWTEIGREVGKIIREFLESDTVADAAGLPIEQKIRARVQEILDAEINPGVASHGGHVSLQDVKGTAVYLNMGGGCQGCGMASVTLRQGVERTIREKVPEVTEIHDATDHAAGHKPYYAPAK